MDCWLCVAEGCSSASGLLRFYSSVVDTTSQVAEIRYKDKRITLKGKKHKMRNQGLKLVFSPSFKFHINFYFYVALGRTKII